MATTSGTGAVAYGAVLGIGVLTIVTTPLLWIGVITVFASKSVLCGASFGAFFGGGRAVQLFAHYIRGDATPEEVIERTMAAGRATLRVVGAVAATGFMVFGLLQVGRP